MKQCQLLQNISSDISNWCDIGTKLDRIYVEHQCKAIFLESKKVLENVSVSLINLLMSRPRMVHNTREKNAILLYEKELLLYD